MLGHLPEDSQFECIRPVVSELKYSRRPRVTPCWELRWNCIVSAIGGAHRSRLPDWVLTAIGTRREERCGRDSGGCLPYCWGICKKARCRARAIRAHANMDSLVESRSLLRSRLIRCTLAFILPKCCGAGVSHHQHAYCGSNRVSSQLSSRGFFRLLIEKRIPH